MSEQRFEIVKGKDNKVDMEGYFIQDTWEGHILGGSYFEEEWAKEDCEMLNEQQATINNFEKLFSETIGVADTSKLLETGDYEIKRMVVKELVDSLMSENEQLKQILKDIVEVTDETYTKDTSMFKVTVVLDYEKYREIRRCIE